MRIGWPSSALLGATEPVDTRAILLSGPSRSGSIRAALVERAKILLLAAQGTSNTEIAGQVGCSRPTVILWRHRYTTAGLDGLLDSPARAGPDRPRGPAGRDPGRHPHPATRAPWGHPLVHPAAGRRARRQPQHRGPRLARPRPQAWRTETFKFSTDPQLEAKVRDVVGLYLHPPERAIVVCVDEKSQIQALARTAPNLPLRPGSPERRTHDYVRHGTTTLFAALEVATGRVTDQCFDRHRHAEFLAFLKLVAKAYRGGSCTWSWTTTAPTPIPRSRPGSPTIPASTCTSPRRRRVG